MKCIFHGDCFDGFSSAYLVKLKYPECEMIPSSYNRPPPVISPGETIYIVDFSYAPEVIEEHFAHAGAVWVMDHHDSAIQKFLAYYAKRPMPAYLRLCLEYEKSGVGIVWSFLFSAEEKLALTKPGGSCWKPCEINSLRPLWIDHVQNRDLWRFDDPHPERYPQLDETHAFMEALGRIGFDFNEWQELLDRNYEDVLKEGWVLREYQKNTVNRILSVKHATFDYNNHSGVWINAPHQFADGLADALRDAFSVVAVYSDQVDRRKVSLRTKRGGPNIRELAVRFGGGGHLASAGFEAPLDFNLADVLSSKG